MTFDFASQLAAGSSIGSPLKQGRRRFTWKWHRVEADRHHAQVASTECTAWCPDQWFALRSVTADQPVHPAQGHPDKKLELVQVDRRIAAHSAIVPNLVLGDSVGRFPM